MPFAALFRNWLPTSGKPHEPPEARGNDLGACSVCTRKDGERKQLVTPDGMLAAIENAHVDSTLVKALGRAFRWKRCWKAAILDGRQPPELTLAAFPEPLLVAWAEQSAAFQNTLTLV